VQAAAGDPLMRNSGAARVAGPETQAETK